MPWTLATLVRAAGVAAELRGDAPIDGIAYDPAAARARDLFCCIAGATADGHDFAPQVVAGGASAVLVERWLDVTAAQALVPRVRDVLGPLAATFFDHPSRQMPVAAVTGTNGKTTVTYLLESIAEHAGMTPGVVGTVSRRYAGVVEPAGRNTPEAPDLQGLLRRMRDAGVDVAILEATSDGLVQGRLRATAVATAGFTNLTQDHLNTHGSMEAYFEAKALLFDGEYARRAVVNLADEHGRVLAGRIGGRLELLTYGAADADIAALDVRLAPTGTRARVRTPEGESELVTRLVGPYNVDNCLCAVGMALHLGIDLAEVLAGIARLESVAGRLERVCEGLPFLVLVDYAHTPDALEKALGACRDLTQGRLIVVFGCGGDRDRAKRPLMGAAAGRGADVVFVTSDNPRSEDPAAIIAEIEAGVAAEGARFASIVDRREAIAEALRAARPGDVVLVAGKGHEQGQQFADRTVPFDDRTVVRELAAEMGEASCRS